MRGLKKLHERGQTIKKHMDRHRDSMKESAKGRFFENRKTDKWKRLYVKFQKGKRAAIRGINAPVFADQIIKGSKGNFYRQVKKVGGMKLKPVYSVSRGQI